MKTTYTDAELLREIRKKAGGISQTKLAKIAGYEKYQTISEIETGKKKLRGPNRMLFEMLLEKAEKADKPFLPPVSSASLEKNIK